MSELFEVLGRLPEIGEEALFISSALWELENPRRDPMLDKLLAAHARDVAARLPEPTFKSVLEGAIVSTMHQGDPSIGRVAMRLGLTPRTLQRALLAYADSSAFGRAFRRWTGQSPAAYRHEQRVRTAASARVLPAA
ncbi:MAG TPA: hypothetical protein VFZ61_26580 [Polyangiales bacterium]